MYKVKRTLPQGRPAIVAGILSIFVILQLAGCKDSGSVGGGFPGSGTNVQVDTLELSDLTVDTLSTISGGLDHFSIGRFQDPLFGDISTKGLLKPVVNDSNGVYTFTENTNLQLRLAVNKEAVYGDTLAAGQFDVVELAKIFRGNEVNYNSEIQTTGSTVASFSATNEDTIKVDLSESWVQKFAAFYNDSTTMRDSAYVRPFPGLAVVPRNSSKIIPINAVGSSFLATNLDISADADSTVGDSLSLNLRDWAFTIDRTNVSGTDASSTIIHNTLERAAWFKFDFSKSNLGARNIVNVKLVFQRDNTMLNASPLGPNEVRRTNGNLRLHLVEGDELPQSIDPGRPFVLPSGPGISNTDTGFYQESDEAYFIDLTNPILSNRFEDVDPEDRFYLTFGLNDGTIRSSIIFNTRAGMSTSPKVIVTSTKTENN